MSTKHPCRDCQVRAVRGFVRCPLSGRLALDVCDHIKQFDATVATQALERHRRLNASTTKGYTDVATIAPNRPTLSAMHGNVQTEKARNGGSMRSLPTKATEVHDRKAGIRANPKPSGMRDAIRRDVEMAKHKAGSKATKATKATKGKVMPVSDLARLVAQLGDAAKGTSYGNGRTNNGIWVNLRYPDGGLNAILEAHGFDARATIDAGAVIVSDSAGHWDEAATLARAAKEGKLAMRPTKGHSLAVAVLSRVANRPTSKAATDVGTKYASAASAFFGKPKKAGK